MNAFKQLIRDNYNRDDLTTIAENIKSGVSGLSYYSETRALYDKFENEIWDIVKKLEESCGGVATSIFKEVDDHTGFAKMIAKRAGEYRKEVEKFEKEKADELH